MRIIPKNIFGILTDYLDDIRNNVEHTKVILYGSYAKGSWKKESDIDIAIFLPAESQLMMAYKSLFNMSLKYEADIQPQVFFDEEYKNPTGIVEEIVSYGIDITSLERNAKLLKVNRIIES